MPTAQASLNAGWISATVTLTRTPNNANQTFVAFNVVEIATQTVTTTLFTGVAGCAAVTGKTPLVTRTNFDLLTVAQNPLNLLNGQSVIVFEAQHHPRACVALPDVPNGTHPTLMFDPAPLREYGVSVADTANGEVLAYVPLNPVLDETGGQRVAFAGYMPYWQTNANWGNVHKIRLAWLVQLFDGAGTRTVHTYYESWRLAGLHVTQELGGHAVALLAKEGLPAGLNEVDVLFRLSQGLNADWLSARSQSSPGRLTALGLVQRFNSASTPLAGTWNITRTLVAAHAYTLTETSGALMFPNGENQRLLEQYFNTPSGQAKPRSLLLAQEISTRRVSLDAGGGAVQANTGLYDLSKVSTLRVASYRWAPFRYTQGRWQSYPLADYLERLGVEFRDLARPSARTLNELDQMVLTAQLWYATVAGGLSRPVEVDGTAISETASQVAVTGIGAVVGVASLLLEAGLDESITNNTLRASGVGASVLLSVVGAGLTVFGKLSDDPDKQAALVTAGTIISVVGQAGAVIHQAVLTYRSVMSAAGTTLGQKLLTQFGSQAYKSMETAAAVMAWAAAVLQVGMAVLAFLASDMSNGNNISMLVAQIVVAAIMLAIALFGGPIGLIIAVLDLLAAALCGVADAAGGNWSQGAVGRVLCGGLTGTITALFQNLFYTSYPVVKVDDPDRLNITGVKAQPTNMITGFVAGGTVNYEVNIEVSAVAQDPLDVPAWNADRLDNQRVAKADFVYVLLPESQIASRAPNTRLNRLVNEWSLQSYTITNTRVAYNPDGRNRLYLRPQVITASFALPNAGINVYDTINLVEVYEVPVVHQTLFGINTTPNGSETGKRPNPFGMVWDVFPRTLAEFHAPAAKEGGFSLAWGQGGAMSPAFVGPDTLTFPRMKDFDGDGLFNQAEPGGTDPNDSSADSDGDGLTDDFELRNQTNPTLWDTDGDGLSDGAELRLDTDPRRADSDGDGLSDSAELAGWLFTYGFDGNGVAWQTRVYADPLNADADNDLIPDGQEKLYGLNPNVADASNLLTLSAAYQETAGAQLLLRLDEMAGATSFSDESGLERALLCEGAECPTAGFAGRFNNAVDFDGVTDRLTGAAGLNLANRSFTVALWAKRDTLNANNFAFGQGAGTQNQGLVLGFRANNTFTCAFIENDLNTPSAYTDTGWHHWACSYDAATRARQLYRDGVLVAADTSPAHYQGAGLVQVGRVDYLPGMAFDGLLDEVAVYGVALNATQVSELAAARHNFSDGVVKPGQTLVYSATVSNNLNDRYAQGLLSTSLPNYVSGQTAPRTFVIYPAQTASLTDTLIIGNPPASQKVEVNQVAAAQVINWRDISNGATLLLPLDDDYSDKSGYWPVRNATCTGTQCPALNQPGMRGKGGAAFDGVNDRLTAPGVPLDNASFSALAWVKFNTNGTNQAIVAQGNFLLMRTTANKLRCFANGGQWVDSTVELSQGMWYQVGCVYDAAQSKLLLYLNGALNASITSAKVVGSNASALKLGVFDEATPASNWFLNGTLDEVQMFDRALSAAEINRLYAVPVRVPLDKAPTTSHCFGSCPTLVTQASPRGGSGYLEFNGVSTVKDASYETQVSGFGGAEYAQSVWLNPANYVELQSTTGGLSGGSSLTCPAGQVVASYATNPANLNTPGNTRCETLDATGLYRFWPSGTAPMPGVSENFFARYTFSFNVPRATTLAFNVDMADGVKLSLYQGTTRVWLADHWYADSHANGRHNAQYQYAAAAGNYFLVIDFVDWAGAGWLNFNWLQLAQQNFPQGILGDTGNVLWHASTGQRTDSGVVLERVGLKLRAGFNDASGVWHHSTTPDVLKANTWQHVLVTFNSATGTLAFYVDGVLRHQTSTTDSTGGWQGKQPRPLRGLRVGSSSAAFGQVYFDKWYVHNENDGTGEAEMCAIWNNSQKVIWNGGAAGATLNVQANFSADLNRANNTFVFWEDDEDGTCGDLDGDDEHLGTLNFGYTTPSTYYGHGQYRMFFNTDPVGDVYLGKINITANGIQPVTPAWRGAPSIPLLGAVDDVQLFGYALNAAQAADLYQSYAHLGEFALDEPPGAGQQGQQNFRNGADVGGTSVATCSGSACPISGVAGRVNLAARFDGADDRLTAPANQFDLKNKSFTVAFWAKRNSTGTFDTVLAQGSGGTNNGLVMGFRENDKFTCAFLNNDLDTPNAYTDTDWHHWACTYNADNRWRVVYRDGVPVASAYASANYQGAGPLQMGNADFLPGFGFDGWLDAVNVYNRELSAAAINTLYQQAAAHQWSFEQAGGATTFPNAVAGAPSATCAGAACPQADTKGQVGRAVRFDGVDDQLSFGTATNGALGLDGSFTVLMWAKPETAAGLMLGNPQNNWVPKTLALELTEGKPTFSIGSSALVAGVAPPARTWTHYAFRMDKAAQTRAIFINGYLNVQGTTGDNIEPGYGTTLGWATARAAFADQMDELVIFRRALSDAEIADYFRTQRSYVEDRAKLALTIDTDTPTGSVLPGSGYFTTAATLVALTATDRTSPIQLVELGTSLDNVSFSWQAAAPCLDASGNALWCAFFAPGAGQNRYYARVRATDAVGYQAQSASQNLLADLTAPNVALSASGGSVLAPSLISGTYIITLTGTVNDPAIGSFAGSGLAEDAVSVVLHNARGVLMGDQPQRATLTGGTWQVRYDLGPALPTGFYTVRVTARDRLGNSATATTNNILLDANLPRAVFDAPISGVVSTTLQGVASKALAAPGLQVMLNLEEAAGATRFADLSGFGRTARCTAGACPVTMFAGALGLAVSFDGVNDTIALTGTTLGPAATLSLWVNTNCANCGILSTPNQALYLEGGVLKAQVGALTLTGPTLNTAVWRHVVLRYATTGNSRVVQLFADGVLAATGTTSALTTTTSLTLGLATIAGQDYLNGHLDEFGVYDRALTDGEVHALGMGLLNPIQTVQVAVGPYTASPLLAPTNFKQVGLFRVPEAVSVAGLVVDLPMNGSRATDNSLRLTNVAAYTATDALCQPAACPTQATGLFGPALRFNGGQSVWVGTSPALNGSSELALAAWVRLDSVTGNNPILFRANGYQLGVVNGQAVGDVWDSTPAVRTITGGAVPTGQWTHLALTWKQNGQLRLYVNGVQVNASAAGSAPLRQPGTPLRVGTGVNIFSLVDEVRVYHRELSAAEVAELDDPPATPATPSYANATLSASNARATLWTYTPPANTEGVFNVSVRASDAAGRLTTDVVPSRVVAIDNLAPRLAFQRFVGSAATTYTLVITDYNPLPNVTINPAIGCALTYTPFYAETREFLMTQGKNGRHVMGYTAQCTAPVLDVTARTAQTCDVVNNCANTPVNSGPNGAFPGTGTPPTITVQTAPYNMQFGIRGTFNAPNGALLVQLDVTGPDTQLALPATLSGTQWIAAWQPAATAPRDGAVYTFTATVLDMQGLAAQATQTLTVDLTSPNVVLDTAYVDGQAASLGQIFRTGSVALTATVLTSDTSGVSYLLVKVLDTPTPPTYTQEATGFRLGDYTGVTTYTSPANALTISQNPSGNGRALYLYVGAVDTRQQYSQRILGPFYLDAATFPDYLGADGDTGQPYTGWIEANCQQMFNDVVPGYPTQRLYFSYNAEAVALAWHGADWDTAGDLFIYLNTIGQLYGNPNQDPYGGGVAYNPYPATNPNTLVLLPSEEKTGISATVMAADYGVWVKDASTAILLRWDNTSKQWVEEGPLPLLGEPAAASEGWLHFDNTGATPQTIITLPRPRVGITGSMPSKVEVVAVATEDDALRIWAALPVQAVNSARVEPTAPILGEPHRLMLTSLYEFFTGSCRTPGGGIRPNLYNDQAAPVDLPLLLPRPYYNWPTSPWEALFEPYDDAYNFWLVNTFCAAEANLNHPECRVTKRLSTTEINAVIARYAEADFRPVQPGEVVTYHYRYDYQVDLVSESYAFQLVNPNITWPNNCPWLGGQIYELTPNTTYDFVFTGTINSQTITDVQVIPWWNPGFINCNGTHGGMAFGASTIRHTPDLTRPVTVDILTPADFIGAGVENLSGLVVDQSDVPTLTVAVRNPAANQTEWTCVDDTPADGLWTCPWDVTATNGGNPPTDGEVFQVRVQATDAFGQVSAWSPWRAFVVDITDPQLGVTGGVSGTSLVRLTAEGQLITTDLPALNASQTFITGTLSDNRAFGGLEVCDAAGNNCQAVAVSGVLSPTRYTFDDVPAEPLPITAEGLTLGPPDLLAHEAEDVCGPNTVGLWRQFTVTQNFTVTRVSVGVNIAHPFRGDLLIKLWSPRGKSVTLIDDAGKIAADYDALVTDATLENFNASRNSDDVRPPFFEAARTPLQPFSRLVGEAAQGTWTLIVCDRSPEQDSGVYHRAQLNLDAVALSENTSATWRYDLTDVAGLDGVPLTYTLVALDGVGNRAATQTVNVLVDVVPPVITATQLLMSARLTDSLNVLAGEVSDGLGVTSLAVLINRPDGATDWQALDLTAAPTWQFTLYPVSAGDYGLTLQALDVAGNPASLGTFTVTVEPPLPSVQFEAPLGVFAYSESEPGAVITAVLNAPRDYTVTVDYAMQENSARAGVDFADTSGTLIFPPQVTAVSFVVPHLADAVLEGPETFTVALLNPVEATLGEMLAVPVTVQEAWPTVTFGTLTYTVFEDSGSVLVTLNLDAPGEYTATVDYATLDDTALAGEDYVSATGTLTFAPGVTTLAFTIAVTADAVVDDGEAFLVALFTPVNVNTGAAGDDRATIVLAEPLVVQNRLYLPLVMR